MQDQNKKKRPFQWKRFIRHTKRNLRHFGQFMQKFNFYFLLNRVFMLEFLILELAVLASICIMIFFFQHSFIFFLISAFCFALLYISHFVIFYFYKDTVNHLLSKQEDQEDIDEQQQQQEEANAYTNMEEQVPQDAWFYTRWYHSFKNCCKSSYKGLVSSCKSLSRHAVSFLKKLLFLLLSLVLLDLPIWFYQVRFKSQGEYTKDYQHLLSVIVGCIAIFSLIPQLFISSIWMINNPHYQSMFGLETYILHIIIIACIGFLVLGSLIGIYQIQFFKKHCSPFDSFFWGLIKMMELVTKVLLISYIIKYSQYDSELLIAVIIVYFIYVLMCTIVFTKWRCYKDNKLKGFIKSFLLNLYARVLFLPYKETPCLQQTLTCYTDEIINKKKKLTKKVLIAPQTWDQLMILNDPAIRNDQFTRRTYTHTVHALRFLENFNLILFCVALSMRHGTLIEYVEPHKVSLYYLGRPCSALFTVLTLFYYLAAGIRTVHYSQHDISGIDE